MPLWWMPLASPPMQQQANGWLQTLYVCGEVVLHVRTIVCVRVYCVCQVIHTYTIKMVTPRMHHATRH